MSTVSKHYGSISATVTPNAEPSIDAILSDLEQYGYPRMHKFKYGWYAVVEMFLTQPGGSFEVKSDFRHETAIAALKQCSDRVHRFINEQNEQNKKGTTNPI